MTETILYWLENSHEPTWNVLADALENIGCKSSASDIRSMYTGNNTLSNQVFYIYNILSNFVLVCVLMMPIHILCRNC